MKYIISYRRENERTWAISAMFDKLEDALNAQRELSRDFIIVSDWVEVRITKLRGY